MKILDARQFYRYHENMMCDDRLRSFRLRRRVGGGMAALLLFGLFSMSAHADDAEMWKALSKLDRRNVFLVEVFTSQGCSSCPPADDNISLLHKQARRHGVNLHVLGWHVDYWDYLGWKDPYSSSFSTRRQRQYAQRVQRRSVYTPQVLINGYIEVRNPSRHTSVINALKSVSAPRIDIDLDVSHTIRDDTIAIQYTQSRASQQNTRRNRYELGVLLVESGIQTTPLRGENRGRELQNDNVVRAWHFSRLRSDNKVTLDIPEDINLARSMVVFIAKNLATQKIEYARAMPL